VSVLAKGIARMISNELRSALAKDKEYSEGFLKEVLSNWRDAEAQLKRTVALIVILAAVFELLTRGIGVDLTFSFIRIRDLRLVEIFLPLVVAYETYSLYALFSDIQAYDMGVEDILRTLHPQIFTDDFNFLLNPANSILTSTVSLGSKGVQNASSYILFSLGFLKVAVIFIAPLMFEIYAYVRLFQKFGLEAWVTWLSLVLSSILCLTAALTWIATFRLGGRFAVAIRAFIGAGHTDNEEGKAT